jgi:hypothetical protein
MNRWKKEKTTKREIRKVERCYDSGGGGGLEPNKTTAETRGHLAIFLSVATANSTPYLVCLLP